MPNNNVMDVAKNIINISNERGYKLSNLKLNNLLYIIQCESFSRFGEPMFVEQMQACENGVKVYNVYVRFLGYGASNLPKEENVQRLSEEDMELLVGFIEVYAKVDVWDLIKIVKRTSPWDFTWNVLGGYSHLLNDFIKTSFWEHKDNILDCIFEGENI